MKAFVFALALLAGGVVHVSASTIDLSLPTGGGYAPLFNTAGNTDRFFFGPGPFNPNSSPQMILTGPTVSGGFITGFSSGSLLFTVFTVGNEKYSLGGSLSNITVSATGLITATLIGEESFSGSNGNVEVPANAILTVQLSGPLRYRKNGTIVGGNVVLVTPEPGTLSLFGTGLIGLAGLVRRKYLA